MSWPRKSVFARTNVPYETENIIIKVQILYLHVEARSIPVVFIDTRLLRYLPTARVWAYNIANAYRITHGAGELGGWSPICSRHSIAPDPVLLSFEEFSVHSSFQYVTESGFICYLLLRPRTGAKQGWKIKKVFFWF